jgi:hypothetical protein
VGRSSVLALGGVVLYLILRRRGPVDGSRAALAALVALAGVSTLALLPWPRFWTLPDSHAFAMPGSAAPEALAAQQPQAHSEDVSQRSRTPLRSPAPFVARTRPEATSPSRDRGQRPESIGLGPSLSFVSGPGGGNPRAELKQSDLDNSLLQSTQTDAVDSAVTVFAGENGLLAWPQPEAEQAGPSLGVPARPERTGLLGWVDRLKALSQKCAKPNLMANSSAVPLVVPEPRSGLPTSNRDEPEAERSAAIEPPASEFDVTGDLAQSSGLPAWSTLVLCTFAAGLLLASSRLALGVWAVERLRRSSRPLQDAALERLSDQIVADLGVCLPVELREADGLGSPATIGWRRPAILLPPEWRAWNTTQQRVVLAHELAHVARRDYPACLLARLSVALHWYHPLVHWLASRLRLEQELAADATAARLSGGLEVYLSTIARLALNHDHSPSAWPERPLLTHAWTGTLLRRIEMLRKANVHSGRAPKVLRFVAYGSLVGLGVLLAGIRGPGGPLNLSAVARATEQDRAGDRPAAVAVAEKAGQLSLDHVPDDASLVVAVRPSALFSRPEVRGLLDAVAGIPEVSRIVSLVDPASIDQITLVMSGSPYPVFLGPTDTQALLGINAGVIVRTRSSRDWLSLARGLSPLPVSEARRAGRVYHQILIEEGIAIGLYQPDERTAIFALSHAMPNFISPRRPGGEPPWAAAWKSVAENDMAIAADVGTLMGPILPMLQAGEQQADNTQLLEFTMLAGTVGPLWEETEHVVLGVGLVDRLSVKLVAQCGSDAGARRVERTLDALLTLGENTGRKAFPIYRRSALGIGGGGGSASEALMLLPLVDLAEQLLDTAQVSRDGRFVRFATNSRSDVLGSLLRLAMLAL